MTTLKCYTLSKVTKNIRSLLQAVNHQEKREKAQGDARDIVRKKMRTHKGRLSLKNKNKTRRSGSTDC